MAKGLGKGIQAFFPDVLETEEVKEISITEIKANPYQPRKVFSDESINELKQSILNHGILQPLLLRKTIKGYHIVVGERRFRAAKEAGLKTVPAIIKELTDEKMMEFALIENLQREDLNPIEEATAYQKLIDKLNVTQEQLSIRLGKSRPHIANHLRLLNLPSEAQQLIQDGTLSMGHGRALLGLKDRDKTIPLLNKILAEKLNVRQVEHIVQKLNENVSRETKQKNNQPSIFIKEKEEFLRERFGTNVSIKKNKKKGKIEIQFYSEDDLDRILTIIEGN